jgi:hypothetical protein
VVFDTVLRGETEHAVSRLHHLIRSRVTPPAVPSPGAIVAH